MADGHVPVMAGHLILSPAPHHSHPSIHRLRLRRCCVTCVLHQRKTLNCNGEQDESPQVGHAGWVEGIGIGIVVYQNTV
jgi:hypothetical protein